MKPLLTLTLVLFLAGCGASPIQKVLTAERLYTTAATSLAENVKAGFIKDPATLQAIRAAAIEADKELQAAHDAAVKGDKIGFQFVWLRASAALDKFLLATAKNIKRKETSWTPSPSSSRFAPYSLRRAA